MYINISIITIFFDGWNALVQNYLVKTFITNMMENCLYKYTFSFFGVFFFFLGGFMSLGKSFKGYILLEMEDQVVQRCSRYGAASKLQNPTYQSWAWVTVCKPKGFSSSPHVCVHFLQVLWPSPTSQSIPITFGCSSVQFNSVLFV